MNNRSSYLITKAFHHYLGAAIMTMLASQLAVITDSVVVGRMISPEALSAVNSVTPMNSAIGAVSILLGTGTGIRMAKLLGRRDSRGVKAAFTVSVISLGLVSAVISAVLILFSDSIAGFLINDKDIVPYVSAYIGTYGMGIIPLQLSQALQSFVETDGRPAIVTRIVSFTAILNLVMDIIFVGPLGLGIRGSALATVIDYLVAVILIFFFGIRKSDTFRLVSVSGTIFKNLLSNMSEGLPLMFTNVLMSIVVFLLNNIITAALGTAGMNIWSICMQIFSLSLVVLNGVSSTIYAVGGVLFGEKDVQGLYILYKRVMLTVISTLMVLVIFVELFPMQIGGIFVKNPSGDMIKCGMEMALRVFILSVIPFALVFMKQSFLQILNYMTMASIFPVMLISSLVVGVWISSQINVMYLWWGFFGGTFTVYLVMFLTIYIVHLKKPGTSPLTLIPKELPGKYCMESVGYNESDQNKALTHIRAFLDENAVRPELANTINLILEELITNVIKYADKHSDKQRMDLNVRVDGEEISAVLKDDGRPFDPTAAHDYSGDGQKVGLKIINGVNADLKYRYMYGQNIIYIKV